jgi:hypothetical protein
MSLASLDIRWGTSFKELTGLALTGTLILSSAQGSEQAESASSIGN